MHLHLAHEITSTVKVGYMEAKKINQEEMTVLDVEPGIIDEERSLILLESGPKKKIDETISTPHQYVSRYHMKPKIWEAFWSYVRIVVNPRSLHFAKR